MRRLLPILLVSLLLLFVSPVWAAPQAQTVVPATPAPNLDSTDEQIQELLERADKATTEAQNATSLAFNLLGLFEAFSFVVAVVGFGLGTFGVARLFSAQNELANARKEVEAEVAEIRKKFEEEMLQKQQELDDLKEELRRSAENERIASDRATLALSLLPLGERQYRVKDFEGALETYRRALTLEDDNLVINYRIGYVYTQCDKLEEARAHLESALRIDPNFAPALANLGHVYRLQAERLSISDINRGKMMAQGEEKLRLALEISPKLVDDDGESWWGSLGGLHRRRGQVDDAIEAYKRAADVSPQSSYPLGNLALLYMQKNDRARMIEIYQRTERIAQRRTLADVGDFWAFADLLVAQLALGKTDEAEKNLDLFFAAAPADSPRMIERPLSTLKQLAKVLTPQEAEKMQSFVERIEQRLNAIA